MSRICGVTSQHQDYKMVDNQFTLSHGWLFSFQDSDRLHAAMARTTEVTVVYNLTLPHVLFALLVMAALYDESYSHTPHPDSLLFFFFFLIKR